MSTRKALVAVVTIISLLCVTGWSQRGRGPEGPRDRRGGPEMRPMTPRHVVSHPPDGARHIIIGGHPYWVYGGVYYDLGDDGYVVVGAPVIRVLPRHYHVVVIRGVVYYVADDVYYRPAPDGYVVVEKPPEPAKVAVPAPEPQASTITVYAPKKDGDGFTPVTLKKIDGGYLGPQGEFYPLMPSVAHLAEMYGVSKESAPTSDAGTQAAASEPAKTQDAVIHVQIHKKNGQGTVDVILKKRDEGYLGPQGEFYPEMPSPSQLAEVYGSE
jgi:hypothetical protein